MTVDEFEIVWKNLGVSCFQPPYQNLLRKLFLQSGFDLGTSEYEGVKCGRVFCLHSPPSDSALSSNSVSSSVYILAAVIPFCSSNSTGCVRTIGVLLSSFKSRTKSPVKCL